MKKSFASGKLNGTKETPKKELKILDGKKGIKKGKGV